METVVKINRSKYMYLFADCMLTKGFTRTSLVDIPRKRIFFIPNSFYELTTIFRLHTIGEILKTLEDDQSRIEFSRFINFLLAERLAVLVNDIKRFPEIEKCWDSPSPVTNAIIDIRHQHDYVPKAIRELSLLQCKYLQIRFYKTADIAVIESIAGSIKDRGFKNVEVLLKYDTCKFHEDALAAISRRQKNIHFLVHSGPIHKTVVSKNQIPYTSQQISSCNDCGLINEWTLHIPSLQGFMENKLFNSCLNRKISIDENGDIGNCPSMKKKYGNIRTGTLRKALARPGFKKPGMIHKDQIEGCRDCEFRYICSDCRAYTADGRMYSKPAKCNYDPYSGTWREKKGAIHSRA